LKSVNGTASCLSVTIRSPDGRPLGQAFALLSKPGKAPNVPVKVSADMMSNLLKLNSFAPKKNAKAHT
jgi:hypothetical protein